MDDKVAFFQKLQPSAKFASFAVTTHSRRQEPWRAHLCSRWCCRTRRDMAGFGGTGSPSAKFAYVGPMLAYVSPMLAYVGPMLTHLAGYVGLCWRMLAPRWPMLSHLAGYVGHMLGICWLSWAYVGDMLGNLR